MAGLPVGAGLPSRQRWLGRRALRLHLALVIAVPGCLAAGGFELSRALSGNALSWVYVFEWPFFAGFACYLWWRLLHEDEQGGGTAAIPPDPHAFAPADVADPAGAGGGARAGAPKPADPQLQAWNEYLARLHAQSPPGGPPAPKQAAPPKTAPRRRRSGRAPG